MIKKGNNVYISGGYDYEIKWLNGKDGYYAKVIDFIPGQNDKPAILVKFYNTIVTADNLSGDYAVLELRYEGAKWDNNEIVHIELCDFIPEKKTWSDRKKGHWVESNAKITKKFFLPRSLK